MLSLQYILDLYTIDFVNKYNISTSQKIPCSSKLDLLFTIRDLDVDDSILYVRSNLIMEFVSLKKNQFFLKKNLLKGRGKKQFCFKNIVTLRKTNLLNFLYFFSNTVLPELPLKYLIINSKINKNLMYFFTIKEISVFPSMNECFTRWPYPIYFSFIIGNKNKNNSFLKFFLKNFYFFDIK